MGTIEELGVVIKEKMPPKEGWTDILNAKKFHYIRDFRSLCGAWFYVGDDLDVNSAPHANDCKTCARRLQKERG